MLSAVTSDPCALQHAPSALQDDEVVVQTAVEKSGKTRKDKRRKDKRGETRRGEQDEEGQDEESKTKRPGARDMTIVGSHVGPHASENVYSQ